MEHSYKQSKMATLLFSALLIVGACVDILPCFVVAARGFSSHNCGVPYTCKYTSEHLIPNSVYIT